MSLHCESLEDLSISSTIKHCSRGEFKCGIKYSFAIIRVEVVTVRTDTNSVDWRSGPSLGLTTIPSQDMQYVTRMTQGYG